MTEDMQVRNLSPLTQSSYVQQVSMFARHFNRSPAALGLEDIRAYQLYLTNQKKLDASSIKVDVSAIRFLYRVTLQRRWDFERSRAEPREASDFADHSQSSRECRVLGYFLAARDVRS